MDFHANHHPPCRKHRFIALALLLSVAIFTALKSSRISDTFDKGQLIRSTFGTDLTPYIAKEKTTYSDGCLQFHGVAESHPLCVFYFSEQHEKNFHISFLHEEFTDPDARNRIRLRRIGESFDGFVPIVAHIPERELLVFGFSNGIGG